MGTVFLYSYTKKSKFYEPKGCPFRTGLVSHSVGRKFSYARCLWRRVAILSGGTMTTPSAKGKVRKELLKILT